MQNMPNIRVFLRFHISHIDFIHSFANNNNNNNNININKSKTPVTAPPRHKITRQLALNDIFIHYHRYLKLISHFICLYFSDSSSLTDLLLSNNNIAAFKQELFTGPAALRKADIHGNPLFCDCGAQWIRQGKNKYQSLQETAIERQKCLFS